MEEKMTNENLNEVMLNEATSTTKLTLVAFTSHLILQWLPVSTPTFLVFAWIMTTFIVILGLYNDMKSNPQNSSIGIKTMRLLTNLAIFTVTWFIALHLFPYLGILTMEEDEGLSDTELRSKLLSVSTGPISGSVMLLLAHLLTTLALMTMMKVGVALADIAFNIVIAILNKN
ncbi:unnamed protein product [Orchesella dallaii]|uniref:Transmembrane protein n=1 Tax=Orchesella dallaii TaxID=48710 RepID=A0ABP1QH30_9HEXA